MSLLERASLIPWGRSVSYHFRWMYAGNLLPMAICRNVDLTAKPIFDKTRRLKCLRRGEIRSARSHVPSFCISNIVQVSGSGLLLWYPSCKIRHAFGWVFLNSTSPNSRSPVGRISFLPPQFAGVLEPIMSFLNSNPDFKSYLTFNACHKIL